MAGQRIKGQEVEFLVIQDGVPLSNVTAVKSLEISFQQEIKSEGYLGETADRKDMIFNGVRGRAEVHFSDSATLNLTKAIVDKAQRRTPGVQFNVKATLNFPSGVRKRVVIPNVEFGEIPLNFGSRSDYGTQTFEFEGSSFQYI